MRIALLKRKSPIEGELAAGKIFIYGLLVLRDKVRKKKRFRFFGQNIADAIRILR